MTRSGKPIAPSIPVEQRRETNPHISIVVPMYNESDAIDVFFATLLPVMDDTGCSYDVLCVDDGSRDSTWQKILGYHHKHPSINGLRLSRNFGKEQALTAGIDTISGDVVVVIDADLQEPPSLITAFIEKWRQGYDMVYGARASRQSDSPVYQYMVKRFYSLFNWLSEQPIPPDAGDFRLLDRRLVEALRAMPERGRFMKAMFAWPGFSVCSVPFDRTERVTGTSKFNILKLFAFAIDGITSFSIKPLRVASVAGIAVSLVALVLGLLLLVKTLVFGNDTPGWTSLMVVALFLGGLQLMALGLIGEYIGRLLLETKQRPLYFVAEATSASHSKTKSDT